MTPARLPAVPAFERREGLTDGTLLTNLHLGPDGVRLTGELERGARTKPQCDEA
ncbi:hypothetical protein [Streptomyces sediminimaris]|uniref:hypothetical protein n=1 Tax=Streptomyces sediminimaris TaxID=3383721 RepID=UPI003999E01A